MSSKPRAAIPGDLAQRYALARAANHRKTSAKIDQGHHGIEIEPPNGDAMKIQTWRTNPCAITQPSASIASAAARSKNPAGWRSSTRCSCYVNVRLVVARCPVR